MAVKSGQPARNTPSSGGEGNAGTYVKIQLLKLGEAYKTIKARTKNDGRHRWKIPSSVKTGSTYTIKITSKTNSAVSDSSNKVFTITKATGATGALKLTTPNGHESWTVGKRDTITWDKGDGKGKVKIELLKSGEAYKTIKARTVLLRYSPPKNRRRKSP